MVEKKITKEAIYQAVEEKIKDSDFFISDISILPNNKIIVEIDTKNGVSIENCIELSKFISAKFEDEIDNYELEVASAGISQPFKVIQQFEKFLGKEVEVLTNKGEKLIGTLISVNNDNFTIQITKKVKLPEAKRKTEITEEVVFNYNEVKTTKYNFRF